jgi:two-component system sensor histidine kinase TctE
MRRLGRTRWRVSLVQRLLAWLLAPLLVIGTVGAYIDYVQARRLTDEAFDQVLASTAIGLAARLETDRDHDLSEHLRAMVNVVNKVEAGDQMHFLVQREDGQTLAGEVSLLPLAGDPTHALSFADARYGGLPVRVVSYQYVGPDGRALIVVAQAKHRRIEAARRIMSSVVWANLLMLLIIVGSVVLAVRQAIAPLLELGQRVSAHEVQELRPLRLRGVQVEVLPLVRALNRLIARVREAADERQTFLNHAAHQLRTPLAGLQAQVELMALPTEPAARQHWAALRASVRRLVSLSQNMLSLARVSNHAEGAAPVEPVALVSLLQEVASLRLDAALERDMDLGYDAHDATVQGSRWMLRELLLNLVDNALNHCPPGSTITARCGISPDSGRPYLEVEDNGPGIAPEDRRRVFDRFVRLNAHSTGSGLGLAIVETIAQRHGATVRVDSGQQGQGTTVRILF